VCVGWFFFGLVGGFFWWWVGVFFFLVVLVVWFVVVGWCFFCGVHCVCGSVFLCVRIWVPFSRFVLSAPTFGLSQVFHFPFMRRPFGAFFRPGIGS